MQSTFIVETHQRVIRRWMLVFIVVLILSGVTAIPAESELSFALRFCSDTSMIGQWLEQVYRGVKSTNQRYPFLFYGFDWLAFAHLVLAVLFWGPYKNPVRNKWVIEFGTIACILIIPFALIAGWFRGIPFWWRLIDCAFGIVGLIPLGICYKRVQALELIEKNG